MELIFLYYKSANFRKVATIGVYLEDLSVPNINIPVLHLFIDQLIQSISKYFKCSPFWIMNFTFERVYKVAV